MDDLSARIQRFRGRNSQRRSHQGTAAKENTRSGKGRFQSSVTSSSTSRSVAMLVQEWTGGHGLRELHQSPGAVRLSRGSTYLFASSRRLAGSVPCNVSCERGGYGSHFAPVTPKVPLLLADTIGLRASPQEGDEAPASSLISRSSTPVLGPAPATHCYSAPFSCVVLDLEITGFSSTTDEILEVGCVELRWTPHSPTKSTYPERVSPCAPFLEKEITCGVLEGLWTRGGRVFHRYVRPSSPRRIATAATAVHGITWETVQHCSQWPVVASELVAYLALIRADTLVTTPAPPETVRLGRHRALYLPPLVAHNALFDARFLEHHLWRCGYQVLWHPQYHLTCTRQWAHVAYPHLASNLDALCQFLSVDGVADRAINGHGALTDATLTALLFLRMCCPWTERFGGDR